MNIESLLPFLAILAKTLGLAFLFEAVIIYFFKIKGFWASIGTAYLINLLSLPILYGACLLVTKIGYEFNVFQFPVQVILFLWWVSVLTDGILLQLFSRSKKKEKIYLTSIVMNTVSYLFLYFLIANSH